MLSLLLSDSVTKNVILLISTTVSILLVMLMVNIITVDEIIKTLGLSEESASVLRTVIGRIQEVLGGILDILSQLMNKLFSFAGIDADFSKVVIDPNKETGIPSSVVDIVD